MDVEVGDIVGWRFGVFGGDGDDFEHHGEVVAIHGDFLCLRSLHITYPYLNPFHSRPTQMCHMVRKKAA